MFIKCSLCSANKENRFPKSHIPHFTIMFYFLGSQIWNRCILLGFHNVMYSNKMDRFFKGETAPQHHHIFNASYWAFSFGVIFIDTVISLLVFWVEVSGKLEVYLLVKKVEASFLLNSLELMVYLEIQWPLMLKTVICHGCWQNNLAFSPRLGFDSS